VLVVVVVRDITKKKNEYELLKETKWRHLQGVSLMEQRISSIMIPLSV